MDAGADARIGRTFGKYTLDRAIGAGGMSTVYEARHLNGHRVAVKLLKPELSINPDVRARFLREGYAANRVDHPSVVRILDDHTTDDGTVFLVLELLEGETLAAKKKLGCAEVVAIGRQLLQVLAAAHRAGVIHRDVKPENVLVQPDGTIKVLDFGIAQIRDPATSSVTATGRMLGTPAFMPPEQAYGRRREIDERSDLWSAGATLFTMLTGRVVHEAPTAEETLVKAATEGAPSVRSIAPEVPAPIAAVIDRALAKDKHARWPSADAMLTALDAAAAAPVAPPAQTLLARSRKGLALVGCAVVAVGAWPWLRPLPAIAPEDEPRPPRAAPSVAPAAVHEPVVDLETIRPVVEPRAAAAKPIARAAPAVSAVASEAPAAPTICGFDLDEEGRRWPRRCPAVR